MKKEETFFLLTTLIILSGIAWAFFIFQPAYQHGRPAEDCSEPYAYPMCRRAATPPVVPEPPSQTAFLSFIGIVALAGFLTFASFRSSVMSQKDLVSLGGGKTVPRGKPAAEAEKAFPGGRTPDTIPDNDMEGQS